eukprot:3541005-Pyramimonas_sp.AAC.1
MKRSHRMRGGTGSDQSLPSDLQRALAALMRPWSSARRLPSKESVDPSTRASRTMLPTTVLEAAKVLTAANDPFPMTCVM